MVIISSSNDNTIRCNTNASVIIQMTIFYRDAEYSLLISQLYNFYMGNLLSYEKQK